MRSSEQNNLFIQLSSFLSNTIQPQQAISQDIVDLWINPNKTVLKKALAGCLNDQTDVIKYDVNKTLLTILLTPRICILAFAQTYLPSKEQIIFVDQLCKYHDRFKENYFFTDRKLYYTYLLRELDKLYDTDLLQDLYQLHDIEKQVHALEKIRNLEKELDEQEQLPDIEKNSHTITHLNYQIDQLKTRLHSLNDNLYQLKNQIVRLKLQIEKFRTKQHEVLRAIFQLSKFQDYFPDFDKNPIPATHLETIKSTILPTQKLLMSHFTLENINSSYDDHCREINAVDKTEFSIDIFNDMVQIRNKKQTNDITPVKNLKPVKNKYKYIESPTGIDQIDQVFQNHTMDFISLDAYEEIQPVNIEEPYLNSASTGSTPIAMPWINSNSGDELINSSSYNDITKTSSMNELDQIQNNMEQVTENKLNYSISLNSIARFFSRSSRVTPDSISPVFQEQAINESPAPLNLAVLTRFTGFWNRKSKPSAQIYMEDQAVNQASSSSSTADIPQDVGLTDPKPNLMRPV